MTRLEKGPGTFSVDAASLAAFRVGFGLILCVGAIRFMAEGWIEPFFVEPSFFFKYDGFAWVHVLSRGGMYALYSLIALFSAMIALGLFYRFAVVAFTLCFAYAQLIDVTNYLNHYYLVVLVGALLAFVPAQAMWSLDAWRKPSLRRATVPALALTALRFQFAVVYFYAGLAKLTGDWLLHAEPLNVWFMARDELPLIGALIAKPAVAYAASWAAFFYDSTIVLWLSWRRTRPFAFVAVLCFHTLTHVFFDIGLFPFIMTLGATLFFSPSWPRRFVRGLSAQAVAAERTQRLVFAAFAVYALVQIAVPLRAFVHGGNVLWDELGMRFSWRVMVREKNGSVDYQVKTRTRSFVVSPHDYLTWRQANEMSGQPDLVFQLAQHIGADLRARGFEDVEVRADARVSLNGRPPAPLLDPHADLLALSDVAPAILPLAPTPPIHLSSAR